MLSIWLLSNVILLPNPKSTMKIVEAGSIGFSLVTEATSIAVRVASAFSPSAKPPLFCVWAFVNRDASTRISSVSAAPAVSVIVSAPSFAALVYL